MSHTVRNYRPHAYCGKHPGRDGGLNKGHPNEFYSRRPLCYYENNKENKKICHQIERARLLNSLNLALKEEIASEMDKE